MFTSMVEALKKMEKSVLEAPEDSVQGRAKMYEIGKKRLDGRYNIWKKMQVIPNYWDWVVDRVCDDVKEAMEYVAKKNQQNAKVKR